MEASSHLSPATALDNMASPQQFLKLEDLHTASSPSQSYDDDDGQYSQAMMQTSPPPVIVKSQQAKKRKSWGQTLPEPKTMLPPRKRAKTDDEKEQRRIERIKRNRAAAHNSRERKRQEAETLAVLLAHANAELDAYRRLHGPLPASVVLPEVQVINETDGTPAPSLVESHGTAESAPSPNSPPEANFNLNTVIKQEQPTDNLDNVPSLPPAFDNLDLKQSPSPLDPTQHSAAMLCDLQCRSSPASSNTSSPASTTSPSISWWAALFLYLMTLQIQTCYKTLLIATWSLSPSRMARMMQASAARLTSRSTTSSRTPLPLRSMALAQLNAATGRPAQRGAIAALQRSSENEATRARARAAAVGQHHLVYQQRKALEERSRKDHNDEKGDQNGGV